MVCLTQVRHTGSILGNLRLAEGGCRPWGDGVTAGVLGLALQGGLLDRFTARYFYKGSETSLHKHTENLVENMFSTKCALKNYLQLLTQKFLSQTTTTF